MAHFVKNDTNFHGARSKTRIVDDRSSKKKDLAPKNSANDDDGWGSIPKSSTGASNCDDGWGDIPQDSSTSGNAWGQDRQVHGKAERNRRFHSNSSTFHVPDQSLPNWDRVDEEFPVLGNKTDSRGNVWEKRKKKFDEMKAIEPTNQTEEEIMIQKAIELSKMEISNEEQRRQQLEEEYRLQTQLLEANPDMFEEFRLGEETYNAIANKYVAETYGITNGFAEDSPIDEMGEDSVKHVDSWDSTSEKITKKEDLQKKRKNFPKEEDTIPQSKQGDWSQPASTASRKSSYSGARPNISKVVDMFGGWGTAATASHRDNVEYVPDHRSSKWDTVDVDFASRSAIQNPITAKPANQLSSKDPPEVKIDNTSSNWDAAEAASKPSDRNNSEVETATKHSSWNTNETETATKLSTWDTVKPIDCQPRNASLTVTSEKENRKMSNVESRQQEDVIKVASNDNWGSVEGENFAQTSDNFELNSENYEHEYASCQKNLKSVSQSEQKISESKDFKTQSKGKSLLFEKNIEEPKYDSSEQSQGVSSQILSRQADTKAKINSLEGKCFDSPSSVESDYTFLLNTIDSGYEASTAQLEIPNQESQIQAKGLPSRNNSSFSKTEPQFDIPQFANQTPTAFSLPEEDARKDPPIPGPRPLHSNYQETSSLPTFDECPGQVETYDVPLTKNGGSHIDPPHASVPAQESVNPVFMRQPMMTPLMNPALIMGMNPMMTQQMMMLSNPFFMQQLQQMEMFYRSMGMPLLGGVPMYPHPMPLLNFANNPNPQDFGNTMVNNGASSAVEDEGIPPPRLTASSPPGINASHLLTEDPSEENQPDDFWFSSFLSSDPSLIPPPKPTAVSAPGNLPKVTPEPKISPTAFTSSSLGATSMCNEGLTSVNNNIALVSDANRSSEVPYATGWGDINVNCNSYQVSGWCDDVDGWGTENASSARSIRNPSEKTAVCRQPASRPNLGHTKT